MTGRQTVMAWGDPCLSLLQLQAFPTATGQTSVQPKAKGQSRWHPASGTRQISYQLIGASALAWRMASSKAHDG
jgi:hypothetical protein